MRYSAVKVMQSISREQTQHLVMSAGLLDLSFSTDIKWKSNFVRSEHITQSQHSSMDQCI